MANACPFLFHLFIPDDTKRAVEKIQVNNFSFIKLPSVSDPSKYVLHHFDEEKNQLYLLQKNYYNPKISSILNEKEKINKNYVSLFINNYVIENENSYACFPIDPIFIFISLIYEKNETTNNFKTIEDYLNNFLKSNETDKKDIIQNTLTIFKKNVYKIKERLKNTCDEMIQNNIPYFKPNWEKIKNFYNFKCVTLYNYIVEQKIVFSDYAYSVDKEVVEKYNTKENTELFNTIKEKNSKQIDKYNAYKNHMNKYVVHFNNTHYKISHQNLKTFTWLIVKGFMCSTIEDKLMPADVREDIEKVRKEDVKKNQIVHSLVKTKKRNIPTSQNQSVIESFFKKKK